MSEEVKTVAARRAQSQADKMRNLLLGKKPRTKELVVTVEGQELTLKFQALGAKAMDTLRAKHAPTAKQRADGLGVNIDTFNPALVAATLIEPEFSKEEIAEIFDADNWSAGELGQIYVTASEVCLEGMDLPSK